MKTNNEHLFETFPADFNAVRSYLHYLCDKELRCFVSTFNMSPNCLICSLPVLNYLADPENLVFVGQNVFFKGFRIVFTTTNLLYWYSLSKEHDLDDFLLELDSLQVDLLRDIQGA